MDCFYNPAWNYIPGHCSSVLVSQTGTGNLSNSLSKILIFSANSDCYFFDRTRIESCWPNVFQSLLSHHSIPFAIGKNQNKEETIVNTICSGCCWMVSSSGFVPFLVG